MEVKLKLSNQANIISAASAFSYKWSFNSGLDHFKALKLSVAVSEIVTDIVQFAFGNRLGEFEMSFILQDKHVEVIIHELGEPFDPERHKYNPSKALKSGNFDGAGFELVRNLLDDFIFLNKGKEGIEFRLLQQMSHDHVPQLPKINIDQRSRSKTPKYKVFRTSPEDAEDISKLIYRTYGHTYYKDAMYYPKKIELSLVHKEKFAVLTRTQDNEAVGYFAVVFSTDSNIGEVGEAVVALNHRRKGIMKLMLRKLIDISLEKGLLGLFGEANAAHTFSQKANARFGFVTTAINLAMSPPFDATGLDPLTKNQPVSAVLEYVPLKKRAIEYGYIPREYKLIFKAIYKSLGISIKDKRLPKDIYKHKTDLDIKINYAGAYAIVVVKEYGPYILDYINQTLEDLEGTKLNSIFLDLPIHLPATKVIASDLRKMGFVFSGLMPRFHKELDYFRMQLVKCPIDFDLIRTYSNMAYRIKGIIINEMQ